MKYLLLLVLLIQTPVYAQPSHLSDKVGSAIMCMDQVDIKYFTTYLLTHYGQPDKEYGGAYWWKVDATMFLSPVTELFVSSTNESKFLGAVFALPPEKLIVNITTATGSYARHLSTDHWQTTSGTNVVRYHTSPISSKMYCGPGR